MLSRLRHGFAVLLLLSASAFAQTWELFAPATSGLAADTIWDMRSNIIPSKNPNAAPHLIYVLHSRGISRFNGLWQYFPVNFGANNAGRNTVLYFDPGQGLWIGQNNGIHFVTAAGLDSAHPPAQDWTKIIFPDTSACARPVVSAIYRDRFGVLWVGTDNCGLIRFAPQFASRAPHSNVRRSIAAQALAEINEITDIVEDSSSLWIGTFDGVFRIKYTGEIIAHYLGVSWVRNLLVDADKRIWAATENGLYLATAQTSPQFDLAWTPKSHDDSTQTVSPMTAVVQDFEGAIWAASEARIYRYRKAVYRDPSSFQPEVFSRQNGWPSEVRDLTRLTVDRSGFVWASSYREGILRCNTIWETIDLVKNPEIGLKSNVVKALSWNPLDESVYVGTANGAAKRDRSGHWKIIPIADKTGCEPVDVAAFFHDTLGFSLMSTLNCMDSKLAAYDGKEVVAIACASPCRVSFDNGFHAFVKLPNDSLWLAGQFHLWSTRINDIHKTADFTRLTNTLGFSFGRFNCFLRQDFQDTAFIWIGTETQGLARYNTMTSRVDRLPLVGSFNAQKVASLHLDRANTLWIGTDRGITRLQPSFDLKSPQWRDFTDEEPSNEAEGLFVFSAANGDIWFDARDGIGRYNPEAGVTYFPRLNGPPVKDVRLGLSVPEGEEKESFWFGTDQGLTVFHGDIIPPVTRITRPTSDDKNFHFESRTVIRLASNTLLVQYEGGDNLTAASRLGFQKAFMKVDDTTKTGREIAWEPGFTSSREAFLTFPEAGVYQFYVRTRDQSGNFDRTPASLTIIADLDAPSVVISQPLAVRGRRAWVRDTLTVQGSVIDADLDSFTVEIIDPDTGERLLPAQTGRGTKRAEVLAKFPVRRFDDKMLRVQVKAVDLLAHTRLDTVTVRVDAAAPSFEILTPETGAQFENTFDARLRFIEQHLARLEYFESGTPPISDSLKYIRDDASTPDDANDRLLLIQGISLGQASGNQAFVFQMSDSAGNITRDTLTVARISSAANNMSRIYFSQDGLVEVHLPPGRASLTLRISPLDDEEYFGKARAKRLEPKSRAYLLEPPEAFGRRATLSFKIIDTTAAANASAIFRYEKENSSWTRIGGQSDTRDEHTWLRTQITGGGVYLMAQSQDEVGSLATIQQGNVTCLPRMFSPARATISEFTDVVFSLEKSSPVTIQVFNTAGRQVKALVENETMAPGRHAVRWNGRDNGNDPLRSGIYIVVVKTNAFTETEAVVIQN